MVSRDLGEAIDLFVERADAEAMLEDVRQDEPALAEALRVEVIALGEEPELAPQSAVANLPVLSMPAAETFAHRMTALLARSRPRR